MKKYLFTCLLTFAGFFPTVFAATPDTVVVAGKQYDRGFFHRLFWGTHYRKVWAEPVRVPFLDLNTHAGGLKPTEKGGSFQTKNLRLLNPDGREYVIRSVDKDASQTLSPEKRKSIIGKVIRDQTSVVHPYGAMIVPPLAAAAGVFHANPQFFVVPSDPVLGEFQQEFANMLVMVEERPEGNWENNPDFGNSKEVVSSKKAFTQLVKENNNRVDAHAFLRARLFDMFLGDWSRREDQWRWATYKLPNGGTYYKPIPRDRDHAFFKFNDGVITWLASLYARNMQTFGPNIKNLKGLNRTAQPLDRSLLLYLTKAEFRQIGDSLKIALTDAVIENAVRQWPENIYKITGKEFEKNLKKRRDQLPKVAERYYHILAKEVEMPGSDESEIFRLTGAKKSLLVEMLKPGKKGKPDTLLYSRTYYPNETKSLKIYGLGEEDTFEFLGEGNPLRKLEIYDGEDEDEIIYKSKKNKRIDILDSGDGNKISETKKLKVKLYQPKANEFDGKGWLLRHRLN
ncbi:hypothetical protein I5M27_07580 [Adhaeribacter sp. BT258]|uniref:GWxTD domain-containing protein n=1 Tax=Adhaeribacter terrigena TaxID=2793070 RepID=A0ABS1C2G9_9BACT|nr:hypothetical protein [Adhaeribacter terrigena]MBK0402843.1 hypothetical protein [Adhaeribacter terrigena]